MTGRDVSLCWDGPYPYDLLADVGITPESSMAQVNHAGFDLMGGGMSAQKRTAWDDVRLVRRRLVLDFFLYVTERPDWLLAAGGEG